MLSLRLFISVLLKQVFRDGKSRLLEDATGRPR